MKILIACEFSGRVRDAFSRLGHDAWSCDLIDTESHGNHIIGDVLDIIDNSWDMLIAHPPCTHLAVSGARYFKDKQADGRQQAAINFFMDLANASIPKICVENPVSIMSSKWRKPDQIIQPWQFGHGESKKTCLWLKGLPRLEPTKIVEPEYIIGKDGKRYSPTHHSSWGKNKMRFANQTESGQNNLPPSIDR